MKKNLFCWNLSKDQGRKYKLKINHNLMFLKLSKKKRGRIKKERKRLWKLNLILFLISLLRLFGKIRKLNWNKLWEGLRLSCLLHFPQKNWHRKMWLLKSPLNLKIFRRKNWKKWESKSNFWKIKKLASAWLALSPTFVKMPWSVNRNRSVATMTKVSATMTLMIVSNWNTETQVAN